MNLTISIQQIHPRFSNSSAFGVVVSDTCKGLQVPTQYCCTARAIDCSRALLDCHKMLHSRGSDANSTLAAVSCHDDLNMAQRLPAELKFLIIAHLLVVGGKSSVSSLSRVSYHWSVACQRALFQNLVVTLDFERGFGLPDLLSMLESSSELSSYICSLDLHGHAANECPSSFGDVLISAKDVLELTTILPDIRSLVLCQLNITIGVPRQCECTYIHTLPQHDLAVTLSYCFTWPTTIVWLFTRLRWHSLCLASSYVTTRSDEPEPPATAFVIPSNLASLDIGCLRYSHVPLREVDIHPMILQRLLSTCGTGITSFGMGFALQNRGHSEPFLNSLRLNGHHIRNLRWDLRPASCQHRQDNLEEAHGTYAAATADYHVLRF